MRSRNLLVLSALATLAAAAPAGAQVGLGLAAGAAFPTGDFGNATNMGYNVSAMLNLSAPLVPIGARIEGMFNQFDIKNLSTKDNAVAVTGNLTYGIGGVVASPYLIGGLGWYQNKFDAGSFGTTTRSGMGFNIGGGVRLPLTGFSAFVEARYHKMSGENIAYVPVTFGINF